MKNYLGIALFTVLVSALYTGIAQFLPQLENRPPAHVEYGKPTSPEELAEAGEGVFAANCVQCHKLGEAGGRCPDLASVGATAADRAKERSAKTGKEYTDVDYLAETLCKPGDYLVSGFGNIMPPQQKALQPGQIQAVVAFLQEQGGAATIKGEDTAPFERFGCAAAGGGAPEAAAAAPEPVGPPEQVVQAFGCGACHQLTTPMRALGPSLQDVGARLDKWAILEAIVDPNKSMAAGDPPYPQGVMKATLDGNGFYERMTAADYQALVEWLALHDGKHNPEVALPVGG